MNIIKVICISGVSLNSKVMRLTDLDFQNVLFERRCFKSEILNTCCLYLISTQLLTVFNFPSLTDGAETNIDEFNYIDSYLTN